jgi:hypothetical protein
MHLLSLFALSALVISSAYAEIFVWPQRKHAKPLERVLIEFCTDEPDMPFTNPWFTFTFIDNAKKSVSLGGFSELSRSATYIRRNNKHVAFLNCWEKTIQIPKDAAIGKALLKLNTKNGRTKTKLISIVTDLPPRDPNAISFGPIDVLEYMLKQKALQSAGGPQSQVKHQPAGRQQPAVHIPASPPVPRVPVVSHNYPRTHGHAHTTHDDHEESSNDAFADYNQPDAGFDDGFDNGFGFGGIGGGFGADL